MGLGLALALGGIAACSSAPRPVEQLTGAAGASVVDPVTGQPVDPATGQVVDPVTGGPAVDPATGQPVAPGSTALPGGGSAGAGTPAQSGGNSRPGSATAPGSKPGAQSGSNPGSQSGSSPGSQSGPAPRVPIAAQSTLFTAAEDRIGITDSKITMCAHAALTYGKAFNTTDADFNVFWTALNTEKGGIFGRKVEVTYENDNYTPTDALTAARACKAKSPFLLLGGIGFDQIPAVRNYVEEQHMFYLHHTATVKGSQGLKYSFTALPSVERTGEAFAQLAASKFKGKKIGIIKRDGANWEPGVVAFKALAAKTGLTIVAERAVAANKGNYTDEILEMKNKGAEVVWAWENALISTQILKQAQAQQYFPNWMLFPFNLTSQTLGEDAVTPKSLDGVAMFAAYSKGDYKGGFSSYADDIKQFEAQYAKYRPDVDLAGNGGDLLFLNWQAQKALAVLLADCGQNCTRNRLVDVLVNYNKVPTSSACRIDFTGGDRRHGSDQLNFTETYRSPSGKINWRNTRTCVGRP